MSTYLIINGLITLLGGLSLLLLTHAPARSRFYVGVFTLSCWLLPWPQLQLAADTSALYLPFNLVFEIKNSLPELSQLAQHSDQAVATPYSTFSWLSISELSQWFWPVTLVIGLCLFSRKLLGLYLLQRQWRQNSSPNNLLWQQAGFQTQHCAIRTMQDCGPGMATGILRPTIWLNQQQQDSGTLHTILLHELTHIRQHDPLWLLLLNLLSCLFWWNPVVRWLCRYSAQQIELSCDEQCQQLLPKGQYQQHLIELTLWANQQRKTLSTLATRPTPMILAMSSTKAFNLQRIQHLNKEISMKLRYQFVLLTFLTATAGVAWSNTSNSSADIPAIKQVHQLMANNEFNQANLVLAEMTRHIEQYDQQQQFDIWYFLAMNTYQQDNQNKQILSLMDKAFALSEYAEQQQLGRAFKTALGLAVSTEQAEKALIYADSWQRSGLLMPPESQFLVAVAHYQMQNFELANTQLSALINAAEINGHTPRENWLALVVGNYVEQGQYAKAYQAQQKTEAYYPNDKNQRLLNDLKRLI